MKVISEKLAVRIGADYVPLGNGRAAVSGAAENVTAGLGDVVAWFTRKTRVDRAVKRLVGKSCGCSKRRASLNSSFPFD